MWHKKSISVNSSGRLKINLKEKPLINYYIIKICRRISAHVPSSSLEQFLQFSFMKSHFLYFHNNLNLRARYSLRLIGAVVAQSLGTWLGNRRVAGSSPARTTQYGVWTGSWRGASSPPGHYRGAHEQGTEPLTARGAILRGSPLALTSLHTLMHVCRSCLCLCISDPCVYNNRVKVEFPLVGQIRENKIKI